MTVTPEREKAIDFSDPYFRLDSVCSSIEKQKAILCRNRSQGNIIVVKLGTTGEAYALKNIKEGKVMSLDRESTCVLEVVQGKANAFIYDQFSVLKNWQKNPQTTELTCSPLSKRIGPWASASQIPSSKLRSTLSQSLPRRRRVDRLPTSTSKSSKSCSKSKVCLLYLRLNSYVRAREARPCLRPN